MIYVVDDFLPNDMFLELQELCLNSSFNIVNVGDKDFSVIDVPDYILPLLAMEGYKITLTFIRKAYDGFDNDLRVHCDGIIADEKTALASVLYINAKEGVTPNGTAFYEHKVYGKKLPYNATEEEFNNIITEDSNDKSKWTKTDYVSSEPNRLLTYDSNYFHAKFPQEIIKGERIVLVCFYSKI